MISAVANGDCDNSVGLVSDNVCAAKEWREWFKESFENCFHAWSKLFKFKKVGNRIEKLSSNCVQVL